MLWCSARPCHRQTQKLPSLAPNSAMIVCSVKEEVRRVRAELGPSSPEWRRPGESKLEDIGWRDPNRSSLGAGKVNGGVFPII